MELLHIPQQQELNATYGAWNPASYLSGMFNQDQQAGFNQQASTLNDIATRKGQMENDQSAQMNPLLVMHQQLLNRGKELSNTGSDIGNQSSQLDLDSKNALYQQKLKTDRATLEQHYSDAEISKLGDQTLLKYTQALNSGNMAEAQRLKPLLDVTVGMAGKAADRLMEREKADNQNATTLQSARIHGQNAIDLEQKQYEHGKYAKSWQIGMSFQNQLLKQKVPERLGTIAGVIRTGKYPDGTEADDAQLQYFKEMFDQDVRTTEGQQWAKNQGIQPTTDANGKITIVNKPQPDVGGKNAPSEGTTKSGVKFKVISQ